MALPASSLATPPSAATLTSSELYTQTLAAEADVLKAAQAWPVLVNDLTDMTNPPARQQLAIVVAGLHEVMDCKVSVGCEWVPTARPRRQRQMGHGV